MSNNNPLAFDIHYFDEIDMDLPDVTGDPTVEKTILVPKYDIVQKVDGWYLNRIDDPTDLFARGTKVVNLAHNTEEILGDGDASPSSASPAKIGTEASSSPKICLPRPPALSTSWKSMFSKTCSLTSMSPEFVQ